MIGPNGQPFTILQLCAQHTVQWHPDGTYTVRRDCVVLTADGRRRVYAVPVTMLDDAL